MRSLGTHSLTFHPWCCWWAFNPPLDLKSGVISLVSFSHPLDDVITTLYYDDLYDPINTHLEKIKKYVRIC